MQNITFTSPRAHWLLLFGFGFLVRALYILTAGSENRLYDSFSDQPIYLDMTRNLLAGKGFMVGIPAFVADLNVPTAIQPPFYLFFLASVFGLFGVDNLLAVRLVQSVFGAATCVFVYEIGRRLYSQRIGLAAGLVMTVYPLHVVFTRVIMIETVHTALVTLLMLIVVIAFKESRDGVYRAARYAALGALFGVAFPARPELVAMIGVVAVLVLGSAWLRQPRQLRAPLGALALMGVICLALALPFALRNLLVMGKFTFVPTKQWGLWETNWLRYMRDKEPEWEAKCTHKDRMRCALPDFNQLTEIERESRLAKIGTQVVFDHPVDYLRYSVSRLFVSYPLWPRESFPPPLGYLGVRERPNDGAGYDAIDDYPLYFSIPEKLRVWAFRGVFALAMIGLFATARERKIASLPILAMIGINIALSFLFFGRERYRFLTDPYWILLAAYGVSWALQSWRTRRSPVALAA